MGVLGEMEMEGTEGITPLDNLFSGSAEPQEPAPPVEVTPPEPAPAEPAPTGEPQPPAPPAEEHEDPKVTAFKAKALDEAKKRQRLEQDYAELQRQNAEYQRYLQQIAAQQQQRQQAQQPKPQGLQPQDFPSYEAYLEAMAEQKATAKAQEIWETNMRRTMEAQRQAAIQQQTAADLADMLKAGKEKYPDFEQVVANPNVPVTDTMLNAMMVIDGGHEVSYYLGQNPMEAARIANLPPSSQSREIGKLARQITAPLQAPVAPVVAPPVAPAPVAAAPAPAVPELPKTLTQTRSAGGQFTKTWTGPTPLDEVVKRKK
jgi:hypothetical protein